MDQPHNHAGIPPCQGPDAQVWEFTTSFSHQSQPYGINVYDDPINSSNAFGVTSDMVFIPFNTTGTVVHFKSRVPNDWEIRHLPVVLLTGSTWNLSKEIM